MDSNNNPIIKNLSNLYYNQTFFNKYGTELFIITILIIFFISLSLYFHVKNHLPYYQQNWNKFKCNPAYMPLAGYILDQPNKSTFQTIEENLEFCTQNMLKNSIEYFLIPIEYIYYISKTLFEKAMKSSNILRGMFAYIRATLSKCMNFLQVIISKILFAIHTSTLQIQDLFNKIEGLMKAATSVVFGAYLTFKSFIISVLGTINEIILTVIYALIITFVAMAPLTFGASLVYAGVQLVLYLAIMIPLIMLSIGFSKILHTRPLDITSPPHV